MKQCIFALSFLFVFMSATSAQNSETKVLITTSYGNFKIKLYNETPKHRDNFIKLVKEGTLDNTLFHRVISNFMIQGGDPESKNAEPGKALGSGGVGYTIPAEFNTKFIHKKGALAAARQGDQVNPTKASSGCQFYIVQGNTYDEGTLKGLLQQKNGALLQRYFAEFIELPENKESKDRLVALQGAGDKKGLNEFAMEIQPKVEASFKKSGKAFSYSPEHIEAYATIGGTPHLDMDYTVFGEVYEGLDVIDKIAAVEKDRGDRPKVDIKMTVSFIK